MGVQAGRDGLLDLHNREHQQWIVRTLTSGLTGDALWHEMCRFMECDVLFGDKEPKYAARLVLWWAATGKPQIPMTSMGWFKPCMDYADVMNWDTEDSYGRAAPYSRVLTVYM